MEKLCYINENSLCTYCSPLAKGHTFLIWLYVLSKRSHTVYMDKISLLFILHSYNTQEPSQKIHEERNTQSSITDIPLSSQHIVFETLRWKINFMSFRVIFSHDILQPGVNSKFRWLPTKRKPVRSLEFKNFYSSSLQRSFRFRNPRGPVVSLPPTWRLVRPLGWPACFRCR